MSDTNGAATGGATGGATDPPGSKFDAAAFWAALEVQREEVTGLLPQYAGRLFLRTLTPDERIEFEQWQDALREKEKDGSTVGMYSMLKALVMSLEDADGAQCFGDEAIPKMRRLNARPIIKLARRAMRLSGLGRVDLEDLAGKSEPPNTSATSAASR